MHSTKPIIAEGKLGSLGPQQSGCGPLEGDRWGQSSPTRVGKGRRTPICEEDRGQRERVTALRRMGVQGQHWASWRPLIPSLYSLSKRRVEDTVARVCAAS